MNKPQKIIIDGYNVVHADEKLKQLAGVDLNRAREVLLKRLKNYLRDRSLHLTVVFDGRGGLTDTEAVLPEKLQVLFSASGHSADELIIQILKDSMNPREFIVVSSDLADIGRTASGLGAQVVASSEFLQRLEGKNHFSPGGRDEKPSPNQEDTDYWLNLFSDPASRNRDSED
jgi:ribosomal protection tetracycline resistance protein